MQPVMLNLTEFAPGFCSLSKPACSAALGRLLLELGKCELEAVWHFPRGS